MCMSPPLSLFLLHVDVQFMNGYQASFPVAENTSSAAELQQNRPFVIQFLKNVRGIRLYVIITF